MEHNLSSPASSPLSSSAVLSASSLLSMSFDEPAVEPCDLYDVNQQFVNLVVLPYTANVRVPTMVARPTAFSSLPVSALFEGLNVERFEPYARYNATTDSVRFDFGGFMEPESPVELPPPKKTRQPMLLVPCDANDDESWFCPQTNQIVTIAEIKNCRKMRTNPQTIAQSIFLQKILHRLRQLGHPPIANHRHEFEKCVCQPEEVDIVECQASYGLDEVESWNSHHRPMDIVSNLYTVIVSSVRSPQCRLVKNATPAVARQMQPIARAMLYDMEGKPESFVVSSLVYDDGFFRGPATPTTVEEIVHHLVEGHQVVMDCPTAACLKLYLPSKDEWNEVRIVVVDTLPPPAKKTASIAELYEMFGNLVTNLHAPDVNDKISELINKITEVAGLPAPELVQPHGAMTSTLNSVKDSALSIKKLADNMDSLRDTAASWMNSVTSYIQSNAFLAGSAVVFVTGLVLMILRLSGLMSTSASTFTFVTIILGAYIAPPLLAKISSFLPTFCKYFYDLVDSWKNKPISVDKDILMDDVQNVHDYFVSRSPSLARISLPVSLDKAYKARHLYPTDWFSRFHGATCTNLVVAQAFARMGLDPASVDCVTVRAAMELRKISLSANESHRFENFRAWLQLTFDEAYEEKIVYVAKPGSAKQSVRLCVVGKYPICHTTRAFAPTDTELVHPDSIPLPLIEIQREMHRHYPEMKNSYEVCYKDFVFSAPIPTPKPYVDVEVVEAHSFSEFFEAIHGMTASAMGLISSGNLKAFREFAATLNCVKNIKDFFNWLITYIPYTIQLWVYQNFPSCISQFVCASYSVNAWMSKAAELTAAAAKEATIARAHEMQGHYAVGQNIARASVTCSWSTTFANRLADFKSHLQRCVQYASYNESGREPFFVQVVGPAGVGKTTAVQAMTEYLSTLLTEDGSPNNSKIYFKNTDKFWAGLTGDEQILMYDDLFTGTPEDVSAECVDIVKLVSGAVFTPRQASVEDKNRSLNFKLVVACSNFPYLHNIEGAVNMDAVHRRRHILARASVRPDLMKPNETPAECVRRLLRSPDTAKIVEECEHLEFTLLVRQPPNVDVEAHGLGERDLPNGLEAEYPLASDRKLTTLGFLELARNMMIEHNHRVEDLTNKRRTLVDKAMERIPAYNGDRYAIPPEDEMKNEVRPDVVGRVALVKDILTYGGLAVTSLLAIGASFVAYHMSQKIPQEVDLHSLDERQTSIRTRKFKSNRLYDRVEAHAEEDVHPIDRVLERQVVKISTRASAAHGIMLNDVVVLAPTHLFLHGSVFVEDDSLLELVVNDGVSGFIINERFERKRLEILGSSVNDVCAYTLEHPVKGMRKIVGHFASQEEIAKIRFGASLSRHMTNLVVAGSYEGKRARAFAYGNGGSFVQANMGFNYEAPSKQGHCGAPIVTVEAPFKIIGIHCGLFTGTTKSVGAFVTKELLSKIVAPVSAIDLVDAHAVLPDMFPDVVEVPKVETENCPMGNFGRVYSTSVKHNPNTVTSLRKLPTHGLFGPPTKGISYKEPSLVLSEESKHGEVKIPIERKFLAFGTAVAIRAFAAPSVVPKRLLTFEEAVNGFEGSPGLDMSKSPGYPWVCKGVSRRSMFDQDGDRFVMKSALTRRVMTLNKALLEGKCYPIIIAPDLKDELVKLQKITDKRTRTFEKFPIEWVILFRVYFGAFNEHMTHVLLRSPSCIGMDKYSSQWDTMFQQVARHLEGELSQDSTWDADYKAFEANMTIPFGESMLPVFDSFYGPDYAEQRKLLLYNMLDCYSVYKGYIWNKLQGNGSGVPITTTANNVMNTIGLSSMYYKCAIDRKITVSPADFFDQVKLFIYGDDNTNDVRPESRDFYNFRTVAAAFADYNIRITPADKTLPVDQAPKLVRPLDREFLKCKTAYSEELDSFVPIVDFDLAKNSIYWCRDTTEEGKLGNYNSFLQAIFFYGRQGKHVPKHWPKFETVRRSLVEFLSPQSAPKLVTYEELELRYGALQSAAVHVISDSIQEDYELVEPQGEPVEDVHITEVPKAAVTVTESVVNRTPTPSVRSDLQTWAGKSNHVAFLSVPTGGVGTRVQQWICPENFILNQAAVAVANSVYWRGTLCVGFQVMSSGWKSGMLIAYFNPFGKTTDELQVYQSSQLRHVLLDLSSDKPVVLKVPFRHYVDYFKGLQPSNGVVFLDMLNKAVYQTGSVQSATIKVTAWWEDTEFYLPNSADAEIVEPHGASVSSQQKNETQGAPSTVSAGEGASVNITNVYNTSSNDQFRTDTSMSQQASAALSKGGPANNNAPPSGQMPAKKGHDQTLDQPNHSVITVPTMPGPLLRATADGPDLAYQLGDKAAVNVVPVPTDFDTMEDEMDLAIFVQRTAYLYNFMWPEGTSPGTQLFEMDMSPFQFLATAKAGNSYVLSPLEFATSFFRYWRGRMKLRFQVVAPKQFTGQLMFVFGYGKSTTPSSFNAASALQNVLFDFGDINREVYLEIDYITMYEWMKSRFGTNTNVPYDQWSLGKLTVYAASPLAGPAGFTNSISVNVWMSGMDFQFREAFPSIGLSPFPIPRPTLNPSLVVSAACSQSGEVIPEIVEMHSDPLESSTALTQDEAKAAVPVTVNPGNRFSPIDDMVLARNFKDIWRKPTLLDTKVYAMAPVSGLLRSLVVIPIDSFINWKDAKAPSNSTAQSYYSVCSRIADCFALWKGNGVFDILLTCTGGVKARMYAQLAFDYDMTGTAPASFNQAPATMSQTLLTLAGTQPFSAQAVNNFGVVTATHRQGPGSIVNVSDSHLRISVPWCSQYKALGVVGGTSNTAPNLPEACILLTVFYENQSTVPGSVAINTFAQPGDGCRAGVFSGVPPQYPTVSADLTNPSSPVTVNLCGDGYALA